MVELNTAYLFNEAPGVTSYKTRSKASIEGWVEKQANLNLSTESNHEAESRDFDFFAIVFASYSIKSGLILDVMTVSRVGTGDHSILTASVRVAFVLIKSGLILNSTTGTITITSCASAGRLPAGQSSISTWLERR